MLPISLFCISQTDFGGNCYLFGFSSPPGLSTPLAVRGNTEAGSSVCRVIFISPGAYFCNCRLLWYKLGKVTWAVAMETRLHQGMIWSRPEFPHVSVNVFFMRTRWSHQHIRCSDLPLNPNLKVKLLLFLHILTVSLFLFLTLKFLCNILAISFFFCYAYQEHFFLLIPFSLHHYLCSFQMRKEDRGQSCLQKDFDALVEGLKTLTGFHPGSGSSMARNANTAGRKRKKKR